MVYKMIIVRTSSVNTRVLTCKVIKPSIPVARVLCIVTHHFQRRARYWRRSRRWRKRPAMFRVPGSTNRRVLVSNKLACFCFEVFIILDYPLNSALAGMTISDRIQNVFGARCTATHLAWLQGRSERRLLGGCGRWTAGDGS